MPQLAITVLGHDRPGIIAETTAALAGLGVNIEDSTMTLLRGHFAMMLVTDTAAPADDVERALAPLTAGGTLSVDVREVPDVGAASVGVTYLLSVHGGDRPGIVSSVIAEVAAAGGNVTDLSTRLSGDLYVLLAECQLPEGIDATALQTRIRTVSDELGVGASLRPLESDEL